LTLVQHGKVLRLIKLLVLFTHKCAHKCAELCYLPPLWIKLPDALIITDISDNNIEKLFFWINVLQCCDSVIRIFWHINIEFIDLVFVMFSIRNPSTSIFSTTRIVPIELLFFVYITILQNAWPMTQRFKMFVTLYKYVFCWLFKYHFTLNRILDL